VESTVTLIAARHSTIAWWCALLWPCLWPPDQHQRIRDRPYQARPRFRQYFYGCSYGLPPAFGQGWFSVHPSPM